MAEDHPQKAMTFDTDGIITKAANSKNLTGAARIAIIVAVGFLPIVSAAGAFFLTRIVNRADSVIEKIDHYAQKFDLLEQSIDFKVKDVEQDQVAVHRQLDDHEARIRTLERPH